MYHILWDGSFTRRVTASMAMLPLLLLLVVVSGTSLDSPPWARITAVKAAATQPPDLIRRYYDTANSRLYGYTSAGVTGTSTIWSAKSCATYVPTLLIQTFNNTVFGLCWAISTTSLLNLFTETATVDYITSCSGKKAFGTSTTWDCATLGNCVFNTIYPDLASTSITLAATCTNNTVGDTYVHATTFPADSSPITTSASGPTQTSTSGATGTSGGLSKSDVMALAVSLGAGILLF